MGKNVIQLFRLCSWLFTVIGLLLLLVCFWVFRRIPPENSRVYTTALVTEIEKDRNMDRNREGEIQYTVHVLYMAEGQKYEGSVGYHSGLRVGSRVRVFYADGHPERIYTELDNQVLIAVLLVMGTAFLLIGLKSLWKLLLPRLRRFSLLKRGNPVSADFLRVIPGQLAVNSLRSYVVCCSWTDQQTGNEYVFKSEDLPQNPTPWIEHYGITSFPVYRDEKHPNRYYVDIQMLTAKMAT